MPVEALHGLPTKLPKRPMSSLVSLACIGSAEKACFYPILLAKSPVAAFFNVAASSPAYARIDSSEFVCQLAVVKEAPSVTIE